jgi:integrase
MGKRRKERVVIISPKARAAVDEYLAVRTDPSPALFIGFQRGMVGTVENRLTPGGAGWICDQVARRLCVECWHPHQLRHTSGPPSRRSSEIRDSLRSCSATAGWGR